MRAKWLCTGRKFKSLKFYIRKIEWTEWKLAYGSEQVNQYILVWKTHLTIFLLTDGGISLTANKKLYSEMITNFSTLIGCYCARRYLASEQVPDHPNIDCWNWTLSQLNTASFMQHRYWKCPHMSMLSTALIVFHT